MTLVTPQKDPHQDLLLKIIVIGDSGVGKSNILVRFCQNEFKTNYVATIGVDFKIKTLMIDGSRLKFQIWDTAGQQRYRTITQTYYKGAYGIVLAYSIGDQRLFENVESWMKQIQDHASPGVKTILIGNKADLVEDRKVQFLQGKMLADKYGMPFLEVSAKTGQNIMECFTMLGKEILESVKNNEIKVKNARLSSRKKVEDEDSRANCSC